MRKKLQLSLILLIIICIFIYHTEVTQNIKVATLLFQNNIFPSLFPFMIVSPFLINYGFLSLSNKLLGPLMPKIFNLSKNASYVLIMSLLSGFPGSAIYAKELYNQGILSKDEVSQIILFAHFSNPIFILTMIPTKAPLILVVHYILSILIGILFKNKNIKSENKKQLSLESKSFFQVFTVAIKNSMENTLFILGVIVFFFMLTSIFNNPLTNIFLELSQGLNYLKSISLPLNFKLALSGALLSFGGFSIHLQTYGILSDMNFSYWRYLKVRLIHALLTFIVIFILLSL